MKKCTCCGKEHSLQNLPNILGEMAHLTLFNCDCGGTLSVPTIALPKEKL